MLMYRFLKCSVVAAALVSAPGLAEAADAARPPAYRGAPAVPYYDWNGFYAGVHVGAFGSDNSDVGFLGGGQVGYNYQVGRYVFGVEGELAGTSVGESVSFMGLRTEASVDWVATLAARFGWLVDPRWLVYGKFGAAWSHASIETTFMGMPVPGMSIDKTSSGWVLGFGSEYALRDNWTAKFEYNMMGGNDFPSSVLDDKSHVFKAGLNYRFGYAPIPGPGGRY
jgi:outer membrane immunogenic protein